MADRRHRLRILHLSDLHARGDRETEAWRRRRVLGQAWEENLEVLLQDGAFDLVCFTGDGADWGRPDEFSEAAEILHALMERLHLPAERLFVVPGNHDVDRTIEEEVWKQVRSAAWQVEPIQLARWLHGGPTPLGFEADWRARLGGRFRAYRHWVREELGRPELVADGELPHAYRQTVELRGVPIHVVGLDTVWLCGGDDDNGKLRLTDQQPMGQLTENGDSLDGFRLVLMHHPFDELADRDRATVRSHLAEHADLVLRGHLHAPEISTWADPDRRLRQLAAGCLYEGHGGDRYPNACQALTLELDSRGRPRKVEVRFRAFSPDGGHWHDDPSLYREAEAGRVSWTVPKPTPSADPGVNPFRPYEPVLPPQFQGRAAELRRLKASLGEQDGVSIVGDWRIGKSSLLRTWAAKLDEMGRTARLLDGQSSAGASVGAFVSEILGHSAPDSTEAAADALRAWALAQPEGLPPVLLIDELDYLVRHFDERFFERLREMLGTVLVVTASRKPVDQLYEELDRTSPFHNRLRALHLGLLEDEAAEAVIDLGSSELDGEARRWLRQWAGHHPYHLQLFGHCLVESRRFGESRDDALDRYRDGAEPRLRELWRRLGERDRQALLGTVQGQPATRRSLRRRGLVNEQGLPFGEVLAAWLREEA